MPCNPAVGGTAKGHLVREIDALGGLMGLAIDATGIQFKMLNRSRGPAVWSPRAQADKRRYGAWVKAALEAESNIDWIFGKAGRVLTLGTRATGIELETGERYECSALVVTTADWARERGRAPLGRVLAYATVGVEPKYMGMGPVPAITKALERAGLRLDQIDIFELNEAFAVQSIAVVRELGIDPARVNVHGGAIALGHPIGASGARVLTTLIYALRARGGGLGVASLCIGGGMGIAAVVEVP